MVWILVLKDLPLFELWSIWHSVNPESVWFERIKPKAGPEPADFSSTFWILVFLIKATLTFGLLGWISAGPYPVQTEVLVLGCEHLQRDRMWFNYFLFYQRQQLMISYCLDVFLRFLCRPSAGPLFFSSSSLNLLLRAGGRHRASWCSWRLTPPQGLSGHTEHCG